MLNHVSARCKDLRPNEGHDLSPIFTKDKINTAILNEMREFSCPEISNYRDKANRRL